MVTLPYLGHMISADGVSPCPKKVKAVLESPRPTDFSELRLFLGIVNYYGDHLPSFSQAAYHLNMLLHKNQTWR